MRQDMAVEGQGPLPGYYFPGQQFNHLQAQYQDPRIGNQVTPINEISRQQALDQAKFLSRDSVVAFCPHCGRNTATLVVESLSSLQILLSVVLYFFMPCIFFVPLLFCDWMKNYQHICGVCQHKLFEKD